MAELPVLEASHADAPTPASKTRAHSRLRFLALGLGVLAAAVLVGALVMTTLARSRHAKELEAAAAQSAAAPPRVSVATARRAPPTFELTLPGNAQPFYGTALYARTNGYLKHWLVDIGDRVNKGQLLAEIDAPDVDDQLAQARANLILAQANLVVSEANLELAKITLSRDSASGQAVSQLAIDQDKAQVKTTTAQVESAKASILVNEATVKQYVDLQSFQKIVAPFAGVITARTVNEGALVTADNPSEARPLFYVMQTNPLRVFVNVPQVYTVPEQKDKPKDPLISSETGAKLAAGPEAIVYRDEEPAKLFKGRVTRTANALDQNTRTLLTEVDVPNPDDALRPGMYLQVKFFAPRAESSVLVPSAALLWRPDGTVVPVLDGDNRVHYRKVKTGRDFGIEVEVLAGLEGGETVVVYPGDALPEGKQVVPTPAVQ
jgi:RND family efflux transporter MFP subunit